jgi:predicted nucleic-acid-binding protein
VRAIDTNVIVRFVTGDDKVQSPKARTVLHAGDLFLSSSVILESEWVLRSAFGFDRAAIADTLDLVAGLPGLTVEDPEILAQAIDWMRDGMDFADALHLASAVDCEAMLSFDNKLIKAAKKAGAIPVVSP